MALDVTDMMAGPTGPGSLEIGHDGTTSLPDELRRRIDLAWAVVDLRDRQLVYQLYRDYYAGRHRQLFASEKFKNTFGPMFREFHDNLCRVVVDTYANALEVTGFCLENDSDDDVTWQLWRQSKMPLLSKRVHREALKSGDAYVLVWPNRDGVPMLWPQKAGQMAVRYDEEADQPGTVGVAAKHFALPDGRARLNLYYADRIEKYVTPEPLTSTWLPSDEKGMIPLPGEEVVANPWGVVPVVHFGPQAEVNAYGQSLLEAVIPLQDALNKSVIDLLLAMEFIAFPQRWAVGLEVDQDDNGKPIVPFTPGWDRIWAAADPEVKFGEFAQADLEKFIAVQNSLRLEIARVSGVPAHYLHLIDGGWPSGEAQKVAEEGKTQRVEDLQAEFGEGWSQAMAIARRMTSGSSGAASAAPVVAQWKPAAPRSEQFFLQGMQIKVTALGVSKAQAQRELGYTEDQIAQMASENATEQAQQLATMALMGGGAAADGPGGSGAAAPVGPGGPSSYDKGGTPGVPGSMAGTLARDAQTAKAAAALTPGVSPGKSSGGLPAPAPGPSQRLVDRLRVGAAQKK